MRANKNTNLMLFRNESLDKARIMSPSHTVELAKTKIWP